MTTLRICFVGDSIVNGTIDGEFLGWPGRLCRDERANGHDLTHYNLGVRAETSRQIAALVFGFGVNDMAEDADTGMRVPMPESVEVAREIISEARSWKPTLWVGPAPAEMAMQPFSPAPGISYSFENNRTAALGGEYRALAAELDVPYLDLFTPLSRESAWSASLRAGDGVHPSDEGYALIAAHVGAWPAWRAWMD